PFPARSRAFRPSAAATPSSSTTRCSARSAARSPPSGARSRTSRSSCTPSDADLLDLCDLLHRVVAVPVRGAPVQGPQPDRRRRVGAGDRARCPRLRAAVAEASHHLGAGGRRDRAAALGPRERVPARILALMGQTTERAKEKQGTGPCLTSFATIRRSYAHEVAA